MGGKKQGGEVIIIVIGREKALAALEGRKVSLIFERGRGADVRGGGPTSFYQ